MLPLTAAEGTGIKDKKKRDRAEAPSPVSGDG